MTKTLSASDLLALQTQTDRRVRVATSPNLSAEEHKLLADYRRCSEKGRKLIALHAASVASLCIGYKTET